MKIFNEKVYGLEDSIRASKYPMAVNVNDVDSSVTNTQMTLGSSKIGSGHDQFLTGVVVQFDVTATIKWWVEAERYHWLDFVSSQSTMHRITKFSVDEQCNEYVTDESKVNIQFLVDSYNQFPTAENYLKVLYNVPVGLELTARLTTNFRQLKTVYHQRKSHRLPEWRHFCYWIEQIPMFKELCLNDGGIV